MPFTEGSWSSPESNLEAGDYCSCCLIDLNPSGQAKVKGLCHLPLKSSPGAPYSKGAIRAAMGGHGIFRLSGVPADAKRKAARRLVSLAREAKIEVTSQALLRLAGMRGR